jgi:uncharacterized SAM-binding protein YcdF (DUF218 family)
MHKYRFGRFIKKFILYLLIFILVVFALTLSVIFYFGHIKNIPAHADAAIVLGAKVNINNTPSDPLLNRTDEAVNLYKGNLVDWIITTGGQGLGYIPESKSARGLAAKQGVPLSKILIETDSHTTYENIQDIVDVAKQHNINSVIIVSDRFHLARGVMVAKYFGFKQVYWDYPATSSYTKKELALNYLREAVAIWAYLPKMWLNHWQLGNNYKLPF